MKYGLTRCASALALAAGLSGWAAATAQELETVQTSGPQETESGPQTSREVVVVTANKREESVQDVAVAVTAVTSQAKQELGIISVTDLTNVTPGLSYTPGNERVTLRGVGRLSNSFGADPGVANYNDGLYTAFAVFAGKDPLLIDRVEVLRGPQGTLYGRNAIGGAINTVSKRPTDDFTTDAVVGFGNYDAKKFGVAVSGPINDWLRYRLVGFKEYRDGIDPNLGEGGEKVGWEINDSYLEGQLEGDIGERFSWWLKVADLNYDKAGPPGGRTATFSTAPYLTNVPSAWFSAGGLTPNGAYGFTADPSIINVTQTGNRQDNPFATSGIHAYNTNIQNTATLPSYDEAIFEAVYETDWFDIKYTGGYTYYDYVLYGDADGTPVTSVTYNAIGPGAAAVPACAPVVGFPTSIAPACAFTTQQKTIRPDVLNVYEESRSLFSNEINLISTTDGPLQWIFGLYQYQENSDQPGQAQYLQDEPLADFYLDTSLGVVANPDRMLQLFRNVSLFNAYGVYGQVDYAFNDQWKLTGGLRWSQDTKESKEEAFLACYIICGLDYFNYTRIAYGARADGFDSRGVAYRRLEGDWEATTGTLGLEFTPTDETLLFGKYSRGYKAGGFNNLGFGAAPYTDPEFIDAYEAGWKQEWLDWGLTTNAAVFFYKYQDQQSPLTVISGQQGQTGSTTFTAFINIPESESKGFELETTWNPIDPLNIGFTYAYLDATVSDTGGNLYVDTARVPGDQAVDVTGNKLAQSPEHKVALNASYRVDFEDGSYLLPTVSWSWRDEFYDTFFNDPNELSPSYSNLDARLNWRSSEGRFGVTAWVRNALDEEQQTSISASAYRVQDMGRYQGVSYAPPRMWGVDLLFNY